MDIPEHLATFTLAPRYIPRSDFITRFLLQDERIMDIIIKELVGQNVDNAAYGLGRCSWANQSISDVVYIPKLSQLSPVLVEVQCNVNEEFITRLIGYSLQLKQEYGQLPKILVITIKSITAEIKSKFNNLENERIYTMNCDYWAESCQIISAETIQTQLNNNPLNKLVALGHFLIHQKRNILSISQKHDPTIQLLYQISKDKFENEYYIEEEKLVVIKDLCLKQKHSLKRLLNVYKMKEILMKKRYNMQKMDYAFLTIKNKNSKNEKQHQLRIHPTLVTWQMLTIIMIL
ncbi:hypothetical protein BDF21DRAFT_481302 [Thamnidium elegans]|nr:hypothetical protein BDF21DRAFT_481302 [Thamnidium elegans]